MLQRLAVLHLILSITIKKKRHVGYTRVTDDRLGRVEKATGGKGNL